MTGEKAKDDWFDEEEDGTEEVQEMNVESPANEYNFELKEANADPKIILTVAGEKGEGKTMTAMSFVMQNKRMVVLQFDDKAAPIKKYFYKKAADRITIHNAVEHWIPDTENITQTAFKTIKYIEFILKEYNDMPEDKRPHYVLIDGFEILSQIAEMAMRYNNKIKPFAGVKNRNVWKERRGYLRAIHQLAVNASLEGLIYTIYMDSVDVVMEDGEVTTKVYRPKWIDVIKYKTDIVLKAFTSSNSKDKKMKYFIQVLSSKVPTLFTSGSLFDVTDKPLMLREAASSSKATPTKESKKKPAVKEQKPVVEKKPVVEEKVEEKVVEEPTKKPKVKSDDNDIDEKDAGDNDDIISQLARQQEVMDKNTAKANKTNEEKVHHEGKTLIMEALRDDYNNGAAPIKELEDTVMKTGVISPKAFNKVLKRLISDDVLYEAKLGYVQLSTDDEDEEEISQEDAEGPEAILPEVEKIEEEPVTPTVASVSGEDFEEW